MSSPPCPRWQESTFVISTMVSHSVLARPEASCLTIISVFSIRFLSNLPNFIWLTTLHLPAVHHGHSSHLGGSFTAWQLLQLPASWYARFHLVHSRRLLHRRAHRGNTHACHWCLGGPPRVHRIALNRCRLTCYPPCCSSSLRPLLPSALWRCPVILLFLVLIRPRSPASTFIAPSSLLLHVVE